MPPRKPVPAPVAQASAAPDGLLSPNQVCALLGGIHRITLWRWMRAGKVPQCVYLEGLPRWRRSDLATFIAGLPTTLA